MMRSSENLHSSLVGRTGYPISEIPEAKLEIERTVQVPDVDAILVPVGGGGLVAGIAVAVKTLKPNVKVIVSSLTLSRREREILSGNRGSYLPFVHSSIRGWTRCH